MKPLEPTRHAVAFAWLTAAAFSIVLAAPRVAQAKPPSNRDFFGIARSGPVASAQVAAEPFGFGAYSAIGRNRARPEFTNMQRLARQGFTLAGPYYHRDWQDFRYAREAADSGLQFIYQIRPHDSLWHLPVDERPAAIEALTDEQIKASVKQQVEAVLADTQVNATVARWSLMPEELRYWYEEEMRYLRLTQEAVREAESAAGVAARPLWMYEPNIRSAEHLQASGRFQDITGKGVYLTNHSVEHDQRVGFAMWSFEQIVTASKELDTLPLGVFQLTEDFEDPAVHGNAAAIRERIRHDVYLGLVKGIKSVQMFSMWENRPSLTTHNEQFEAYGSVATDLTGELNLQNPLLHGEVRNEIDFTVIGGGQTIEYTHQDGTEYVYDALSTLDLSLDGQRYVLMVNSGQEAIDVRLDGLPQLAVMESLLEPEGIVARVVSESVEVGLEPFGVAAYRFRPQVADLSGNGVIDAADYTIFRDSFPGLVDGPEAAYVIEAWRRQYGNSASTGVVLIPEPSSSILCLALVVAAGARLD